MVVRRGVNESSIVPMAAWAREKGVILRFIEYMDVGHSNGWRLDEVVPADEAVAADPAVWPTEPADPAYRGEVAGRWRYLDGGGEFGVISSVTRAVLRDCTRARISAEGSLHLPVRGGWSGCSGPSFARRADDDAGPFLPRSGRGATTATRSCARLRPLVPAQVEMFAMGG